MTAGRNAGPIVAERVHERTLRYFKERSLEAMVASGRMEIGARELYQLVDEIEFCRANHIERKRR